MKKRLSDSEKESIKKDYTYKNLTMKQLSVIYGVGVGTICNNLKEIKSINKKKGIGAVEENCTFTKLNKKEVKQILLLSIRDGVNQKEIGLKFNVHQSTVSYICTGKTWKHLFQGIKSKYNKEILSI